MGKAKILDLEGARIIFRNFSGKEQKFNPAGKRNFCVLLDDDIIPQLQEDGWNIKFLRPRDPEDKPQGYLQVAVAYSNFPPKIYMISGKKKTELDEESVGTLDWAEIEDVDLTITPYTYEVNGRGGVKAYVKSMYVTIVEDRFAAKYDTESANQDTPW